MSFRRPSYFDPLPSRRMYSAGNMLIEPWIDEPVLPLLGARPFASSLMSSVFDILEPLALLDRMDRMINRLIGGAVVRRRPIRRRAIRRRRQPMGVRGFRGIRPTIQAAPQRRRVRGVRRAVSVTRRPQRVQPMLPQQMRPKRMRQRPVSLRRQPVQPQVQQRRRSRSRSVQRSLSQQPLWQQWQQPQQIGGIRRQQRQPSIGRQVSVQRQPSIGRQRPVSVQRQPQQQLGRQMQQPMQPIQRQQKQRLPQVQMGRQVPIQQQQQQVKKQYRQQQPGVATTGDIGKLSKAAQPVTGIKLPQLYRICLDTRGCNPKDIKCNVQTTPSGQCNLILTGCGPYRRCYTLPSNADCRKMKKYVTPQNMYVIECPLVETPRCLDISTQPQIKQDCVSLKVNIPEFIDPNKVQVNLKDNDLILRFETKLDETTEYACRVHYYNKVTLPAQTNLDMLKCHCVRGCLNITAPIIGAKKQPVQPQQQRVSKLPQVGAGKEVSGEIQPEKKMRHRKMLKMQQQEETQKGVQPTPTKAQKPAKAQKLPKPEEISIGVQKPSVKPTAGKPTGKPTGKAAPGAPVTPSTTPVTKPKKEKAKKQPTEAPVSGVQQQKQQPKVEGEVKQPTKKEGKKGKKGVQQGQQEQQGRISSGVQQIHDIFASSGTSASQGQQQQQQQPQQPQQKTSEESMGRPVSPSKA